MVILLGGSEQDISMFLDTPRLRDEPRDEEGRDDGRLRGLHLRLHHRMLGDVDTGTDTATNTATGVRASPKDDCGMPWADCTKSLQRCGEAIERKASTGVDQLGEERASFEDDGEDDKDNERTTEQRFEVAESYEIRTAASKQYGVEVSKKEKWTRGNDLLFIFVVPILIPMVLCVYLCVIVYLSLFCSAY